MKIITLLLSITLFIVVIFTSCDNGMNAKITDTKTTVKATVITHDSSIPTTTIPAANNHETVTYSVLDLIVPEQYFPGEAFSISIFVTNTSSSHGICNIPIIITDSEDPTVIINWMVRVILNTSETNEVIATGIQLDEGYYRVEVGNNKKNIDISYCGY